MVIEDLIPKALLTALEQEGKSLVHTPEGWITVDTAAIQLSNTLPLVLERLNQILEEVKKDANGSERVPENGSRTE